MGKTFNMVGGGADVVANPAMTGTEIDLQGLEVNGTKYKVPLIRPNLLDNWYFVGGGSQQGGGQFPINQKGQTSYNSIGYTVDRWRSDSSNAIVLNSNGISITAPSGSNGFLINILSVLPPIGSKLTASILTTDGKLAYGAATFTSSGSAIVFFTDAVTGASFRIDPGTTKSYIRIPAGMALSLQAVKLELGDTQTLAHNEGTDANPVWVLNEIPNYTEELWKCQRYYQLFASSSYRPTYGEDYRPPMRLHSPTKGTISIGGTTYYYANANL